MADVWLPETPVIFTEVIPGTAVPFDVSIRDACLLAGFGEIEVLTPFGKPDTERLTDPLKPYSGVTVKGTMVPSVWPIVTPVWLEIVNVGMKMPKGNVVVLVSCPEVPVTVTVDAPTGTALPAASTSSTAPFAGFGENEAVTPFGSPEAVRVTFPVKPYSSNT